MVWSALAVKVGLYWAVPRWHSMVCFYPPPLWGVVYFKSYWATSSCSTA